MTVQEVFGQLRAPVGITSLLGGLLSGDMAPLERTQATSATLDEAKLKLAEIKRAQDTCGSDWAYWGYEGERAYWSAAVAILEAASIAGPDNLPDVRIRSLDGLVLMDAAAYVEQFGRQVLDATRRRNLP